MILITKTNIHITCALIRDLPNNRVLVYSQERIAVADIHPSLEDYCTEVESKDIIQFLEKYL